MKGDTHIMQHKHLIPILFLFLFSLIISFCIATHTMKSTNFSPELAIAKIHYEHVLGADATTCKNYYFFKKSKQLFCMQTIYNITITGQTTESVKEICLIQNTTDLTQLITQLEEISNHIGNIHLTYSIENQELTKEAFVEYMKEKMF